MEDPRRPETPSPHPLVHAVRHLQARAGRDDTGRLWVEGVRFVIRAVRAGLTVDELITSPVLLRSVPGRKLARELASDVPRTEVSPETFRACSTHPRASGLAAVVRRREHTLPRRLTRRHPRLWLALEQLRSPGNLGTLLRTASAVGAGLFAVGPRLDPWDAGCVRASMGAVFDVPIVRTDHAGLQRWTRRQRVALVGADASAAAPWTAMPPGRPLIIAIGDERRGLSRRLRSMCTDTVAIPMAHADLDSLNAAVAGSVLLYEAWRQQRDRPTGQ